MRRVPSLHSMSTIRRVIYVKLASHASKKYDRTGTIYESLAANGYIVTGKRDTPTYMWFPTNAVSARPTSSTFMIQ